MIEITVLLHTDEFIIVGFYKNENGRQNRSSGAKSELLRRAGVIGHISTNRKRF